MGFFSLNWFKSNKQKEEKELELIQLQIEKQKIENEITNEQLQNIKRYNVDPPLVPVAEEKPYAKAKLVNKVLTVVLNDGSFITKTNATEEDFVKLRCCKTESEVLEIVVSREAAEEKTKELAEIERNENIRKGIGLLEHVEDVEVKEGSVYFKGMSRSMPQLLVEKLVDVVGKYQNCPSENLQSAIVEDVEYQSLKNFFMWCCLNPRAEVADELYGFLMKNSFRITKQGFFVALRNVVNVSSEDNTLVQFVSNSYNKIKAVWKKKPSDYWVILNNGEYSLEKNQQGNHAGEVVGNLQDLYLDLPNMKENRFTDNYTRTFDIRVGRVVNMPPEKCSWSTRDCAEAGLKYVAS